MKRKFSEMNKESNLIENVNEGSSEGDGLLQSFKRITRSSLKQVENIIVNVKANITKINSPESSNTNKKKSIPLSKCPYVNFTGEIRYYSKYEDILQISTDLLKQIEIVYNHSKEIPISFDAEWPFNFKNGPGKISVLQLSLCGNICYVLSIGQMDKIPKELINLLGHAKVVLYGVNIKNDLRKLQRDFPNQVNSDMLVEKCVDLGSMYNDMRKLSQKWSLEKLVNKLCRLQIDKSMKIRMSKWNNIPLEENQLKYAANDVYIGHTIYEKLCNMRKEKQMKGIVLETEV